MLQSLRQVASLTGGDRAEPLDPAGLIGVTGEGVGRDDDLDLHLGRLGAAGQQVHEGVGAPLVGGARIVCGPGLGQAR